MKKAIGIIFLIGSFFWCLFIFPLSLVPIASLVFEHELLAPLHEWLLGKRRVVKIIFAVLAPYAVFKFGGSLIRSSKNMITGTQEETQQERFSALVEKKLNKLKNEDASKAGTDAQKEARRF